METYSFIVIIYPHCHLLDSKEGSTFEVCDHADPKTSHSYSQQMNTTVYDYYSTPKVYDGGNNGNLKVSCDFLIDDRMSRTSCSLCKAG